MTTRRALLPQLASVLPTTLVAGHVGGGVSAVADGDLAVSVLEVPFDGMDADHEDGGDFQVGAAVGQQLEDLGLAGAQAVGAAGATTGRGDRCRSSTGRSGGTALRHSRSANGQRGAKAQPGGMVMVLGGSPRRVSGARTSSTSGVLCVTVRDDGADFAQGTGLAGLEDRVEAIGGRIILHSPRGAGTSLRAEFPLTPPTATSPR